MTSAPTIEAHGLEARYGGQAILAVGHLAVERGRTLALLGPNGAGKSTLLRILALLERSRHGSLSLLGEAITGHERQALHLRRRMATVFQDALLTDQTVFENVAMGLRFRGIRGGAVTQRVMHWLERFGIGALAARRARTLSGGEAQRVSLARAFVVQPELLFLDEPFASLDQHGREALALELGAILGESRIATVLVTHDRSEALMLADEVAVLIGGTVRQCGAVREVLAHPADAETARFLGVENILEARVVRRTGAEAVVEVAGQRATVALPSGTGDRVLLAVRAEDVHLAPPETAADPGRLCFDAQVTRVVPFGVPYRVHLDAGVPLVALAAQRTIDRLGVAPGTRLAVSVAPAQATVLHG